MDFSRAEFDAAAPEPLCGACRQRLVGQYWSANGATVCEACAGQLRAGPPREGGLLRAFKAVVFGSGAGLVGALGYGAIIYFAHVELALVTIFIGWLVGRAVRFGSHGYGGRGYQVLGAVLTYVWCMMAYVPSVVSGLLHDGKDMPRWFAILLSPFLSLALPFLGDMGVLGLAILGFGVWRGWREPAPLQLTVEGPFSIVPEPRQNPEVDAAAPSP